mgnify:CR=1 FL=1
MTFFLIEEVGLYRMYYDWFLLFDIEAKEDGINKSHNKNFGFL